MFCQNCGSKQPDDGLFCNECGEKLPQIAESDSGHSQIAPQSEAPAAIQAEEIASADAVQPEAVQGAYASAAEPVVKTPVTGSYSFAEKAAVTEAPVTRSYSSAPDMPVAKEPPAQSTYSAPPAAMPKKKKLFDDSDPQGQPPKPPKAKKVRPIKETQPYYEGEPAPKKGNGMYIAIIGTLAAVLIGVGVWLVLTLGKVSSVNAELASKDSTIAELQQSVNSLTSAKQQDASTITSLQSNVTTLQGQVTTMQVKSDFFDDYAAIIIPDDGTKLYHTYDCTHYDHDKSFLIYNVSLAKNQGYSPCSYCH